MKKSALLLKAVQDIRASYWFIPAVLVIAASALAQASKWLDHNTDILPFGLPDTFLNTQIEGARATLSVIATSVIGVTGVMFSMTILAVSFAAGNYGPRLIGNFMRDRGNQVSLGILIATFVYALMILRAVQDPSEPAGIEAFVPQYSMLIAMLGCTVAVFTMIYFVHHVPETINVSNITAALGAKLEAAIKHIIDAETKLDQSKQADYPDRAPDYVIQIPIAGFVQTMNYNRLQAVVEAKDRRVELLKLPGDFVTQFTDVMNVWTKDTLSDEDLSNLRDCFAIGTSRTENQNVFFLLDELVEMLARALSPGVNDPFTAMNCLNWMYNAMQVAAQYNGGLGADGSRENLLGPRLKRDALYDRSFEASRPYCETDPLVKAHFQKLTDKIGTP